MHSRRTRRFLRALWRDTRALTKQFRVSLIAFALLLGAGTLLLRLFYVYPGTEAALTWMEALHAALTLVFMETVLPFPQSLGLQLLFIIMPIIGLAVAADGLLRFGLALFYRHGRKEAWQVAIASTYRDHIVVCGLGRIGYRVVKELLRLDEEVVAVEQNPDGRFLEQTQKMDVPVLLGDARQQDMLVKARVPDASAIVICTQDDLTNLDVALEARDLNPAIKVVLRMFDAQLASRVRRGFGIHTAFSTSALAAPVFAAAATRAQIDQSFYVEDVLMNVARATVQAGSALEGRTVAHVEGELDITVVLHKRGSHVDPHPAPEVELLADDCLVAFASLEALAHLRQASGETERRPCQDAADRPARRSLLQRLIGRGP